MIPFLFPFLYSASMIKNPEAPCMGTKTKRDDSVQTRARGDYYYKWKTYGEVDEEVEVLGYIINSKGFAKKVKDPETKKTISTIGICSINREEWLITDLACNWQNITSVPLYETLGNEMLEIILNQTEMATLFGSDVCLTNILKLINGRETFLKNIVTFDGEPTDQLR